LGLHALDALPEDEAARHQAVYNALMRAILDALRNLDLEYHQAKSGAPPDAEQNLTSPDTRQLAGKVGHCAGTLLLHVLCIACRMTVTLRLRVALHGVQPVL